MSWNCWCYWDILTHSTDANLRGHFMYQVPCLVLRWQSWTCHLPSDPSRLFWICTNPCLFYLAARRLGSPGQTNARDPTFPLQLFRLPCFLSLNTSIVFMVQRKHPGWGPQSDFVKLNVPLVGIHSVSFSPCHTACPPPPPPDLLFIIYRVYFQYSVIFCFTMFFFWDFGSDFSIWQHYRWRY